MPRTPRLKPVLVTVAIAGLAVLATMVIANGRSTSAPPEAPVGSQAPPRASAAPSTTAGPVTTTPGPARKPRCQARSATPVRRSGPATAPSLEWGQPQRVSTYRSTSDSPEVLIRLTGGSMLASWKQAGSRRSAVVTSSHTGSEWGPPTSLGRAATNGPSGTNVLLASTLTRRNMAAVVWQALLERRTYLVVSDRIHQCWSAPHPLATGSEQADVEIGPDGRLTVAWMTKSDRRDAHQRGEPIAGRHLGGDRGVELRFVLGRWPQPCG